MFLFMILSVLDGILVKFKWMVRCVINCLCLMGLGDMIMNILFFFFIIIMLCILNKRCIFIG